MNMRSLALLSCSALLVACGGGDGGSSGSPVTTPSPSPSPSPTPTPTPSGPSYTAYADLTGSQQFDLVCVPFEQGYGSNFINIPTTIGGDPALHMAFDASAQTYRLTANGVDETFGPADVDTSISGVEKAYAKTDPVSGFKSRLIIAAPAPGGTETDYVRNAYLYVKNADSGYVESFDCVFGVPTLLTDPPKQTNVSFTDFTVPGSLSQSYPDGTIAFYRLSASNVSLSVNVTTGAVKPQLDLTGTLTSKYGSGDVPATVDFGTYAGETQMDGERQGVGGLFNWQDWSYNAPYEGWFFGPQGVEAGFAVGVRRDEGDGRITMGTFTIVAAR